MNPDPKPGRWILPLVVLGMVAFTYFFVRALPTGTTGSSSDTTLVASDTTVPGGDNGGDNGSSSSTTTPQTAADPAVQAYLEGAQSVLTSLEEQQREMAAVNGGFDADPRTVEYADAVARLEALGEETDGLVEAIDALTPPESLATIHETIRTAVVTAASAADETLAGLKSTDDGTQRRNAVAAFDTAVTDLRTAIDNARSAAGLGSAPTAPSTSQSTTPSTTPETSPSTTPPTTGG